MASVRQGVEGRTEKTETGRLLRAYHERGDSAARDRLVEVYLPLVETLARRHRRRGQELDDLVQAGSIGLINAIDRFRFERGSELSAFAVPNIEGEIKRHLRDTSSSMRVPRRLQELSGLARRRREELTGKLGRVPTTRELARELELEEEEVERALDSERARLATSLSDDGDGARGGESEEELGLSEDRLLLAGAFRALDEEERRMVYMRFIGGASRAQTARDLGISQRQLSRRLSVALSKLRAELEEGGEGEAGPPATKSASTAKKRLSAPTRAPKMASMGSSTAREADRLLELPYHIVLRREENSGDGRRWRASVEELPGCEARGRTSEEAAAAIAPAMEDWIEQALAKGANVPEPRSESNSSGRLLLRMPQTLHAELARAADREEVSLNGYITGLLAGAVGWQRDGRSAGGAASGPGLPAASGTPPRSRFQSIALIVNIVVLALSAIAAVTLIVLAVQQG